MTKKISLVAAALLASAVVAPAAHAGAPSITITPGYGIQPGATTAGIGYDFQNATIGRPAPAPYLNQDVTANGVEYGWIGSVVQGSSTLNSTSSNLYLALNPSYAVISGSSSYYSQLYINPLSYTAQYISMAFSAASGSDFFIRSVFADGSYVDQTRTQLFGGTTGALSGRLTIDQWHGRTQKGPPVLRPAAPQDPLENSFKRTRR